MRSSKLQFTRPVLIESEFVINQEFCNVEGKGIEISIRSNIDTKEDLDNRTATVSLTIEVGEKNSQLPFYIKVTEKADFKWDESWHDKYKILLSQNAPALLLGYIRQIIASLTAASQYSVYHLPLIDFSSNTDEA